MILAVDIGNSTVHVVVMKGRRIVMRVRVDTLSTSEKILKELGVVFSSLALQFHDLDSAIVCSVVPEISQKVCMLIKKKCNLMPLLVGQDIDVPIKNNYLNKSAVGQDRLVCAYAASVLHGTPCIIIDFGTAITIDFVSATGAYEGGMIIPGVRLSAKSLFENTALLPCLDKFKIPKNIIGKTTQESILSGIFYGYSTMCDGLIARIKNKHAQDAKVILTGGYTQLMKKFITSKIDVLDSDLIFKGLLALLKLQ